MIGEKDDSSGEGDSSGKYDSSCKVMTGRRDTYCQQEDTLATDRRGSWAWCRDDWERARICDFNFSKVITVRDGRAKEHRMPRYFIGCDI